TLYEGARHLAAGLMGLSREREDNVVLTRNATEGAALSLWLSGLLAHPNATTLVCTDAENVSIARSFRLVMDHGNPKSGDLWSSFEDDGVRNQSAVQASIPTCGETGVQVRQIGVLAHLDAMESEILRNITPETGMVVFSHVVRDTGYVCDVPRLCMEIRKK